MIAFRCLRFTLTHPNLLVRSVPITPIVGFILRTSKKVGFGSIEVGFRGLGFWAPAQLGLQTVRSWLWPGRIFGVPGVPLFWGRKGSLRVPLRVRLRVL